MMNVMRITAVLFGLLMSAAQVPSQEVGKQNGAVPPLVLSVARRTLESIRTKDVEFLASLTDPAGITIGVDASKISVGRFKRELAEKRGGPIASFLMRHVCRTKVAVRTSSHYVRL